jgi:formylglycine-generating enzyme required for sulfatase activity
MTTVSFRVAAFAAIALVVASCGTKNTGSFTETVNGVSFEMIAVDGGTFTMGATAEQGADAAGNENPAHSVTLSGFAIGKYEVTQELWLAVMGTWPHNAPSAARGAGNDYPAYNVSWDEARAFIKALDSLTGKTYRLPTEAEWEFAARGGTQSAG